MFWWTKKLKRHYYRYKYMYQFVLVVSVIFMFIAFIIFAIIEGDRKDARDKAEQAIELQQRRNDAVASVAAACNQDITSKYTISIVGINTDSVVNQANELKMNCLNSSLYRVVIKKAK